MSIAQELLNDVNGDPDLLNGYDIEREGAPKIAYQNCFEDWKKR